MKNSFTCLAAAHQPNFFPWLGWFDKLRCADVLIILDDVQFPRGVGNWGNRVGIQHEGRRRWLAASLDRRFHGFRSFGQMRLAEEPPWRRKCAAALTAAYRRAPHAQEALDMALPLLLNPEQNLVDYNMNAIRACARLLGLDEGRLVFASQYAVASSGTQRLVDLCKAVGADAYMCGGGAAGYQDDACFARHGLGLVPQNFHHPVYTQFHQDGAGFLPGLSVLDALFCLGPQNIGKIFA